MIKISKEIKVGVFAFLGVAVFVVGYNFLKGIDFLKANNTYYVVYNNVEGIVKSTQVTINGLAVGQVSDIKMLNRGDASKILLTILISSDIKLPKQTKATITGTDLLGSKVISLNLSTNSEYLNNKDTITAGAEESLTSTISGIVSPLKDRSEQVLATLDRVLKSMNDIFDSSGTQKLSNGINDFSGIMLHVKNITKRLDELSAEENEKVKAMFASAESITRTIKNSNEVITKTLKNISQISDSIAASNLTATINNTNRVMADFALTIEKINKGEGSLGKLANDQQLYDNLTKSSAQLNALMKDMEDYPARYFSVSVFGNSRASKQDKKRKEDKKQ